MLQLPIRETEFYNEATGEFIPVKAVTLQLEHSLISISKWESKWEKPFLSSENHTHEQIIDYIRCMTVNQNVDPNVYLSIGNAEVRKVTEYINAKQSATWFYEEKKPTGKREVITSELIYYWMVAFNIPFECQKWHLNRLLTLVRICSIKNQPPKKRSKREILQRNAALNAKRRAQYNTTG